MSLTIQLPTSIEHQLRDHARREGLSLERFVTNILVSGISVEKPLPREMWTEAELLRRVHLTVSPEELEEFYRLSDLRRKEQLSEVEYEKLVALTHRVEIAHAERMKYVVALSKLWEKPLAVTLSELGIKRSAA